MQDYDDIPAPGFQDDWYDDRWHTNMVRDQRFEAALSCLVAAAELCVYVCVCPCVCVCGCVRVWLREAV